MTRLSRDLLERAFPNNPVLVGQFEEIDEFLANAEARVVALLDSAEDVTARLGTIEATGVQPLDELLTAISGLGDEAGAIEMLGGGQAQVRGIDTTDAASLASRGVTMLYAGKDTTANRPTVPSDLRAIYFDTTLHANGKPIFWTGAAWVDSTGAAV